MSTPPQVPQGFELEEQSKPTPPPGFEMEGAKADVAPPPGAPSVPRPRVEGLDYDKVPAEHSFLVPTPGDIGAVIPRDAQGRSESEAHRAGVESAAGVPGYSKMGGAVKKYAQSESYADPNKARTEAGTELLGGAMEAARPAMLGATMLNPAPALIGMGTGVVAGKGARKIAEKSGATPETQDLMETAGFFLPSALGMLRSYANPKVEVVNAPEVKGAAGEAFGGKVQGGVAVTPEAVRLKGKVGPFEGEKIISRATQKPQIEPPTIQGNPQPQPPAPKAPVAPSDAVADATRAAVQKGQVEAAAARVARGLPAVPEPPPPPPPPMMTDDVAHAVGAAIRLLPPEHQSAAILEATQKTAESILHHGGAVVDGEVHIATKPQDAIRAAKKIVEGQIAKHDEAAETSQETKPAEVPNDRRQNSDLRKKISEMSPDEMRSELLTSPTTGLPNRRAFDEAESQSSGAVAMSDADGLKALNDRFGYEAGNSLLKAKADALREAGVEAYHDKGDEFLYRGVSPDDLKAKLEHAREILRNTVIEATKPDGTVYHVKGADFSYGTGKQIAEAESGLKSHKSEREARGERARGELRGIVEVPQGNKNQSFAQPAVAPTQEKPLYLESHNVEAYLKDGSWYVRTRHPEGTPQGTYRKVKSDKLKTFQAALQKAGYGEQGEQLPEGFEAEKKPAGGTEIRISLRDRTVTETPYTVEPAKDVATAPEGFEIEAAPDNTKAATRAPIYSLIDSIYQKLKSGDALGNINELNKLASQHLGDWRTGGKITPKDVFDAMEAGINRFLLDRGKELMAMPVEEGLSELRGLMERVTSQGVRTEEQIKNQQFSTPPTESYVAARLADIKPSDIMLEPSAGNGGLAVWAKAIGAEVHVNEISERRQEMLEAAGFDKPTAHDGELINSLLDSKIKPTVIVMNPPFSASTLKSYEAKNRNQYGFNHVDSALQRLEENGRLVAILGGGQANEPNGGASLSGGTSGAWFDRVAKKYNIRANVRISGREYQKYGTAFATRLIVIDKIGPTPDLKQVVQGNVNSLEEAYNLLAPVAESRPQIVGDRYGAARNQSTESAAGHPSLRGAGQEPQPPSRVGANQSVSAAGDRHGAGESPVRDGGIEPSSRPDELDRTSGTDEPREGDQRVPLHQPEDGLAQPAEAGPDAGLRGSGENPDGERPLRGTEVGEELALGRASKQLKENEDSSAYVTYHPTLEGPEHPGSIVETKTMATVPLPEVTYRPSLPDSVIKDGKLSAVQLEAISIAGQQNEIKLPGGFRASALIGDGTGVGKGRIAAGILWDNFRKGRKRLVWVSENWNLMNDAKRDLMGIGASDLAKGIKPFQKFNVTAPVDHEGVLFTTYALLRSADAKGNTRIGQLQQWMNGKDEGEGAYILFDESHNLKNAVAGQGGQESLIGKTVKEFLGKNPKLRSTSLSATAATDVINLGYLDRLGLWGPGTAFPNGFNQFAAEIGSGGISAMEMVARELKAQGKYLSRTLSFKGVTYQDVQHALNAEQKDLYRTAVKAWRSVVQHAEDTIVNTNNGGVHAQARFLSLFYGAQLRFFNVLLTTLKIPTAVEQANKALADGKSVVITLINTNEAAQNREKMKMAAREIGDEDEVPEYDFGPAEMLTDLVREHYPTQQYKDDVDSNGRPIKVPVVDADGHPVQNPEAIRRRDQLLLDIKRDLKLPANPLDILINSFGGPKNVAELTGRKERYDESLGRFVKRGDPTVKRDDINKSEAAAFQDGKKRVAILSNAASTGISLQADLGAKNRQKRQHITLQVGWSADKAMQMLGRTHRTNQAHPPEYVNIVSDLGGEQRFSATIAKRLGSLGALTKGQKDATGGTDLMEKVNFESEQGRAAAKVFYDRMLRNTEIPGIDQRGMDILDHLAVLKEDPKTGVVTVPDKDRTNVTRLLNRLLALDPDIQNAVYNYYYDIFQATVQQAVEAGTLDTGVKTLPGDEFHVKEERAIAKDPSTGAETFYYPVDAKVRNERLSFNEVERSAERFKKSEPRLMKDEKGNMIFVLKADPIVHADGRLDPAVRVYKPSDARGEKVEEFKIRNFTEINEAHEETLKEAKSEVDQAKNELDRAKRTAEKYPQHDWARDGVTQAEADLKAAEKTLVEAVSSKDNVRDVAKKAWDEQFDKTPTHSTKEHHLLGGALLKYWNAIRDTSRGHLNIYTTVDANTGQRVVGVDVPHGAIRQLLDRITGGKSTVDASQLAADVMKNNLEYTLEGNIQVKKGRVNGFPVFQLMTSSPDIQQNLKRLGVTYEKGVAPVYYVPTEDSLTYRGPDRDVLKKILDEYPVKSEPNDDDEKPDRRNSSEAGFASAGMLLTPITAPINLVIKINEAYDQFADKAIQKSHFGRALPEVEAIDSESANLMREHRAAPQYYRAKADKIVEKIVGNLSREQEKGFMLLGDKTSSDWLAENHHDEWLKYQDDPEIQKALELYKPFEDELREAQRSLGGPVIEEDYIRRVYDKYIAGITNPASASRMKQQWKLDHPKATEKELAEAEKKIDEVAALRAKSKTVGDYPKFDKVITPQMANKKSRQASPEYYYKNGLHEFGPSFAPRYVATQLKLIESKIAADFMQKATKLERGDTLPAFIEYNGRKFWSSEAIKLIKMSRANSVEGKALAEELGVEQLPKPSELIPYSLYTPFSGSRLESSARNLAENAIKAGKISDEVKKEENFNPEAEDLLHQAVGENAGSAHGMLKSMGARYLGPKPIIEALERDGRDIVPEWVRDFGRVTGPVVGALRQQLLITGIPHIKNILRRVMHQSPVAQTDPRSWVRAWKVLMDKELKDRALQTIDDPTFDSLLRHAGISVEGAINFEHYLHFNLEEGSWENLWGTRAALQEAFSEPGVRGKATGVARIVGEGIRAIPTSKAGKWWHDKLFGPGGLDHRARLYIADLVRAEDPTITDAELADRLNEQLGRYAKASWTDLQRDIQPFMMFPGWNYSSVAWVLRHPIRTLLPAALLILLANRILHALHQNRNKDKNDMRRVHVGGRSWSDTLLKERLASENPIIQMPMDYARARIAGKRHGDALGSALMGLSGDAGALLGEFNPLVSAPLEIWANRKNVATEQKIASKNDFKHRGKVIPRALGGKGTEDLLRYGASKAFPQTDALYPDKNQGMDWASFIGRNIGTSNFSDTKRRGKGLSFSHMGVFGGEGGELQNSVPTVPEGFELEGPQPGQEPEIVPPGDKGAAEIPKVKEPEVTPDEVSRVGKSKDGEQIKQPKITTEANQRLATSAAPELESKLSFLASEIPGSNFVRLRPQKSDDRLNEKTDDKSPNQISDYLAAQISIDSPQAKDKMMAALKKNFRVLEVEDRFLEPRKDKAGYPSANLQIQMENGSTAEVQLVPKEVQDISEDTHPLYKAGREAEEKGDTAGRDRQWAEAAKQHESALNAFRRRNNLAPSRESIAKGSTVQLRNGDTGEVAYLHPEMNIARVKVGGKMKTVNLRELQAV